MAVAWLGWLAVVVGWPASVGTIIHRKLPDLHPSFQPVACALALTTSFAWLGWMIRQPKDHPLSPAVNWTAGPVLLYTLAMSIWLPALESNMSYRHLGAARDHLPPPTECVSSINLGEPQRAMFHYYTGLKTERRELGRGTNCNWLLTVANARHPEPDRDPGPGWTLKWQDIHSRKELFRLYQRDTSGDAHSSR
jgi:4-amino-4-deoxy-L-arabinose transferase-like glycosyltransferase